MHRPAPHRPHRLVVMRNPWPRQGRQGRRSAKRLRMAIAVVNAIKKIHALHSGQHKMGPGHE